MTGHYGSALSEKALRGRLTELFTTVGTHVPFYARLWAPSAGDWARRDPLELLGELPVATKDAMRAVPRADLLDVRARPANLRTETTTGSSGQPFAVHMDGAILRRRQVRTFKGLWHAGYRPGNRLHWLRVMQGLRKSRLKRLAGLRLIDLGRPDEEILRQYEPRSGDIVYGQYSALLTLTQALLAQRPVGDARQTPRIVIGFGEQITQAAQRTIASTLGAAPTDLYGLCEVGLVAVRRPDERSYRVLATDLLLEYLPSGVPGFERLVITNLAGGPMPFVRYDTGDLVRRDFDAPGHPLVEIAGRSMDFLIMPDGRRVAPFRIDNVLDEIQQLGQYRIVQQPDGTVDFHHVTPPSLTGPVESAVRDSLRAVCGDGLVLRLHRHDDLELRGLAKLRVIRSLVGNATRAGA